MENTRNEKAAIMICTYIIGFTTAYIGYGLTQPDDNGTEVNYSPAIIETQTASVIDSQLNHKANTEKTDPVAVKPTQTEAEREVKAASISEFLLTERGLEVMIDGSPRLVSMHYSQLASDVDVNAAVQGVYEEVTSIDISNSKKYLYFCERGVGEIGCVPFVYDATIDSVRPVLAADNAELPALSQLSWRNDILVANGVQSISKDTPWLLVSVE